jgi:ABC-2 type transport system permease protein
MKALHIAWKDTLTRFRDWKALAGMLAAPLLISALIGLALGNLVGGDTPVEDIPVAIVNHDDGDLGVIYEEALGSEDLSDLVALETMDDLDAAKARIEAGELRAVVYVPAGFTDSLLATDSAGAFPEVGSATVQVFTDPAADISPAIIKSIVEQISTSLNTTLLSGQVSGVQAAQYAQLLGPRMADLATAIETEVAAEAAKFGEGQIELEVQSVGDAAANFDPFAFFIPGMAVFFLMFSMFDGPRSILQEQTRGTLPRLMTTPTPTSQIILGKMGGTFFTGLLQFVILIIASTLLFGIDWGSSPLGVATITVLTVFAAAGFGSYITTFARNENQASIIASAFSLIFGALGGSFFPASNLTGIVDIASKLTLNRWAMEGFTKLIIERSDFAGILPEAGVLAAIGLVTFFLAIRGFERRFVK